MRKKRKYEDFFSRANRVMSPERSKRADARARKTIALLRLAEARKRMKLRQTDIKEFSQSEISKIERRRDIKLSTLVEYMRSIGMGLKIIGIPGGAGEEEVLLLEVEAA